MLESTQNSPQLQRCPISLQPTPPLSSLSPTGRSPVPTRSSQLAQRVATPPLSPSQPSPTSTLLLSHCTPPPSPCSPPPRPPPPAASSPSPPPSPSASPPPTPPGWAARAWRL
ncbi:unnamed protein product [Closterium sp. NIES-54]